MSETYSMHWLESIQSFSQKPVGKPKCGWEISIKIYLKEMGVRVWTGFIWNYNPQDMQIDQ
jgi:hypothetical protein